MNLRSMPLHNRILYGLGSGVYCMAECVFVALTVYYGMVLSMPLYILAIICFLACLIPPVITPIIFEFISTGRNNALGKYHIGLILTVISISLCIIFMGNLSVNYPLELNVTIFFLLAIILQLSVLIFRYIYKSIGNRIAYDYNETRQLAFSKNFFYYLSILAVLVVFTFLFDMSESSFLNISYIIATAILALGLILYFTTINYLPKLVDYSPSVKRRKIKQIYTKFYESFSDKNNRYAYFGNMFSSLALFMLAIAAVFLINIVFGFRIMYILFYIMGFFLIILLCYLACFKTIEKCNEKKLCAINIFATIFVLIVLGLIFFLPQFIAIKMSIRYIIMGIASALLAVGIGLHIFSTDKLIRGCSVKGDRMALFNMRGVTTMLAIGLGLSVISIVYFIFKVGFDKVFISGASNKNIIIYVILGLIGIFFITSAIFYRLKSAVKK